MPPGDGNAALYVRCRDVVGQSGSGISRDEESWFKIINGQLELNLINLVLVIKIKSYNYFCYYYIMNIHEQL